MSFIEIECIPRGSEPPQAKLSYMRPKLRKGGNKPGSKPELRITIPTTVCGTAKAETFVLQVGSGANAGKIRIVAASKAGTGVKPSEMKNSFVFKFGYVPQLGDDIFDDERGAARKVETDVFEIDVSPSLFAVVESANGGGAGSPSSKPAKK
ncbi:hypothetical protein HL667_33670 [Bradyrhizobium sp. 83012]|uniref:Uncharacterized protein n=1 Tax=Bradyrhizobium aeschynomenes TaxID=2734909 RepID=A0ABX2CP51_9BRAD|nr:hypothetical protein [Bradyrhizobium aeschynomenes]NPU69981.1 hypothetical protein [Bradyrhizobium aeschynomenes]